MDHNEPTVARRTLGRAIDIAGGPGRLAEFLSLRLGDVLDWSEGHKPLPSRVFLAMVDIVSANGLVRSALKNLSRRQDAAWAGADRRRPLAR